MTWYRWTAFGILFTAWTVALLIPIPKDAARSVLETDDIRWWFGKTLHALMYATLTRLGGGNGYMRQHGGRTIAVMSAHAFLTEFFQQFVQRGASLRDVGIDHVGITVGVIVGRLWNGMSSSDPKV